MRGEIRTGSRIRERRVMAGLKQADLARLAGISASYLNLIEHNRRRIGGKLLLNIAAALAVEPQILTEGAEAALIGQLREAADEAGLDEAEAVRADEFAGRFPGWADVLAGTRARIATLEQTVETLSDRLAHDPHLAASMHELLSTAAAIRSTASILAETETLRPEWRDRFHANLDEDSRRLADSAQALIGYLDAEADTSDSAMSPQEEVESFVSEHKFHFPSLESGQAAAHAIETLIEAAVSLRSPAAGYAARAMLQQVAADAARLSLQDLQAALGEGAVDPIALAQMLQVPVAVILRRLAALPDLNAGMVVCDRSGAVLYRKPVEGFTVPMHGSCCPLWPVFAALAQPGVVVSDRVVQAGRAQAQFDCFATSETITASEYGVAPMVAAVMLLVPAPPSGQVARSVGATCRVCPQDPCALRREPSVLGTAVAPNAAPAR